MIQKKICLVGAFAVGKTSLVARFVRSMFSDKYLTTIGVKIDKKVVLAGPTEVCLMLWDLVGQDEFGTLEMRYVHGSSGYLLVADGARRATLECAIELQHRIAEAVGPVPFRLLINKADLQPEWEVTSRDLDEIASRGWDVRRTSAKTGDAVEAAFVSLTEAMLRSS